MDIIFCQGIKVKCCVMGSCVLSAPLDGMKVNAFTLLSLSVALNEKLFYLRSSVCCLHRGSRCQKQNQSSFHLVSLVCMNVEDLSLADRFSLIDESKNVVPARQLLSPSLAPQRASLLSADQRRKNTVNLQPEPLKAQLTSFLSLTQEDHFDF